MTNILPEYKTRVRKLKHKTWRVSYWMPYSGHLYYDAPTWKKAMKEAWEIEKYKAKT